MPVLVGDFVGESRDLVGAGLPVVAVTELAGAAAEAVSEGPLGLCRGVEGAAEVDREGFKRLAGTCLGGATGLLDGAGQPGAEVGGEGGHGQRLYPDFGGRTFRVSSSTCDCGAVSSSR